MAGSRPPAAEAPREGQARPEAGKAAGGNMIPARSKRLGAESFLMRIIATAGIIGIGVALGAILVGQDVEGWIVGLVISIVSVVLAAVLWSSNRL